MFVVAAVLFAVWFCGLVLGELRELNFYRENGWDFSVDSGINWVNYYHGESTDPGSKMSNRARVLYGRPFFMVIAGVFAMAFAFAAMTPQNA